MNYLCHLLQFILIDITENDPGSTLRIYSILSKGELMKMNFRISPDKLEGLDFEKSIVDLHLNPIGIDV